MEIILYQPQIPQNTGNIVRTCAVTNTKLTLITPLGFKIDDYYLKRAGLDYWAGVEVNLTDDLEKYLEQQGKNFYFFSSKTKNIYTSIKYENDDILIFGNETKGLPPHLHEKYPNKFVTLPMVSNVRCLNLSNSVAIARYEAWRQHGFN